MYLTRPKVHGGANGNVDEGICVPKVVSVQIGVPEQKIKYDFILVGRVRITPYPVPPVCLSSPVESNDII